MGLGVLPELDKWRRVGACFVFCTVGLAAIFWNNNGAEALLGVEGVAYSPP